MKIAVICGSPKGEQSLTLHYVKFLQQRFPEHEFAYWQVASQIKKIRADQSAFQAVIDDVQRSVAVIWCFPVYCFSVPAQLKRFVELVFERNGQPAFNGKYATAVTTSVHCLDHTAHNYIHAVSEDLGLHYLKGFSADMQDLSRPERRNDLADFFRQFLWLAENRTAVERAFAPVSYYAPEYRPVPVLKAAPTGQHQIVLLTDAAVADLNLQRMTEIFVQTIPNPVKTINIRELDIKGGCLGCCRCAENNVCIYRDDIRPLFKDQLLPAAAVIYAGTIRDRGLSWRWKEFFDRCFFNGHCPLLRGKQIAWLISGPLRQIPNLSQTIEAWSEVGGGNLVGLVTDEDEDAARTTALLRGLGPRVVRNIEARIALQPTFIGVGAHKIFRDLVYELKFFFRADYRFYRRHGLFDYPQKNVGERIKTFGMRALMLIPAFKKYVYRNSVKLMLAPAQKIVGE